VVLGVMSGMNIIITILYACCVLSHTHT
jgi:hypothetical protein